MKRVEVTEEELAEMRPDCWPPPLIRALLTFWRYLVVALCGFTLALTGVSWWAGLYFGGMALAAWFVIRPESLGDQAAGWLERLSERRSIAARRNGR